MRKLIHITDPHITAPGVPFFGLDTAARLQQAFAHMAHAHPDAEAIVLTGDLTDTGDIAAYELCREVLAEAPLPVHLTLGNHDKRGNFRAVFGGEGFVQSSFDLGDWRVVVLDTADDASHYGMLDGGRLAWLEAELAAAAGRPTVLALHHTPGDFHIPCFGLNDLRDADRFLDVVVKSGVVRHMLFGHRHVGASGSMAGIPFSANRGTAQHIALDWEQQGKQNLVAAAPGYDVVCLTARDVIVHREDGLDGLPLIRPGDPT